MAIGRICNAYPQGARGRETGIPLLASFTVDISTVSSL